jgi:DNA polymerase III subunit beta
MYFEIEKNRLIKPLTLVTSVVEKRQTLPILSNIYVKLENGTLTLVGTDLEVEISFSIPDVIGEDGECTVTARKLYDICRSLPEKTAIKIKSDGVGAQIQSAKSRFKLQTLPAADFPRLDTKAWEERLKIPDASLKKLLDSTAFSMAQQDVRYFLNGVLFEVKEGRLRAVATDGHRLAKSEVQLENGDFNLRQVIVPRKAVLEMQRFLEGTDEELTLEINPNHICLTNSNSTLITKLIDGRFPDYETVMAQQLNVVLLQDRSELIDVLTRTAILTNEKFRGIRLNLSSNLIAVTAHNPEQEEANDEIITTYDGPEVDIGFNVNYLLEALKALNTDLVELKLQDSNSGCTIREPDDEETLYLVMPMRL